MPGSAEYEVLIRHTVDLQLAVKANLISLGAQLVAVQVITPDQYQEIRNPHLSVNERAADLIGYVQSKVRQSPQHYHAFIDALRKDESEYRDVLAKLEGSLLNRLSPQLPITTPSSRECGNRLPIPAVPAQGMSVIILVLEMDIVILACTL